MFVAMYEGGDHGLEEEKHLPKTIIPTKPHPSSVGPRSPWTAAGPCRLSLPPGVAKFRVSPRVTQPFRGQPGHQRHGQATLGPLSVLTTLPPRCTAGSRPVRRHGGPS